MLEELSLYGKVYENYDLKNNNTYRVSSICQYFVLPNSISDLQSLMKYLKANKCPYFIIGNGSNIILDNNLKDYVVVSLASLKAIEVHKEYNMIYVEAGAMLPKVAAISIENSLTGLEFAIGIPGTLGGSIVSNAGAYNCQLLDYARTITALDENFELVTLDHEELTYGYRTSMFKEKKNYLIVSAKFYLKEGNKEESLKVVQDRKLRRSSTQPLEYPSAGSVFRNPIGDAAGRLIELCGLKGKRIGGAEVSFKHANFIINIDNATSNDIIELINLIHDTVLEKTGVDLIKEQEYIK